MIPILLVSLLVTPKQIPLHNCDKIIFYELQIAENNNDSGFLCVNEIQSYPDKRQLQNRD
jgi:hypothetical protein